MISLADYLTEFPEESGKPFKGLAAAKPKAQNKPHFEHLTLVSAGVPQTDKARKPIPQSLEAIPEMGNGDEALEDVTFDAADFGFDSEPAFEAELPEIILPQLSDEDIEAARAEGHEAGRLEALAEAEERMEVGIAEALAAERERAAVEMAEAVEAARIAALAEEGGRLGELVTDKLDRIETALRTSFASVLKPIAIDLRTRQTVDELAASVATLSLDGRSLSLQAFGPAALLDAFAEALGPRRGFVAFEADDNASDIRITCDQTTLETRLADWKQALEETLQ